MTWPGSRPRFAFAWLLTSSLAWGQEVLEDQDPIDPDWAPAWDTPFWAAPSGAALEFAAGRSGGLTPPSLDGLGQGVSGDYVLALLTLPLGQAQRPLPSVPEDGDPEAGDGDEVAPEAARGGARPAESSADRGLPAEGKMAEEKPEPARSQNVPSESPPALEMPLALLEDALDQADKAGAFAGSLRRLGAIRERARWSGLAPELRLRGASGIDQTRSIDSAGLVPSDQTQRDGSDSIMEIRLTFHLERLLHAGPEVALERARQDVLQDRAAVRGLVGKELVTYVRARRRLVRETLDDEERDRVELSAEQARLSLYLLTGGWFRGEETWQRYEPSARAPHAVAGGSDAD